MSKLLKLNLDKKYTDFVISKSEIFQYIHPNYLTITGLLIDFVVLWAVFNQLIWLIGISLFFRYTCDCLDGAVARKYHRVSDLGGILDTIADNTLIFVVAFSIAFLLNSPYAILFGAGITLLNIVYLLIHQSLVHHYNIKKGGNLIQNIYTLGVNNNCILYAIVFSIIAVLI